jgi:hypothetical protein
VVFEKGLAYEILFLRRVFYYGNNIDNSLLEQSLQQLFYNFSLEKSDFDLKKSLEQCITKSRVDSLGILSERTDDQEEQDKKKFRTAIDSLTQQLSNVPQSNIKIIANMNVDNTKDIDIGDEKIISETSENFKKLNSLVDEYLTIKSNMEVDDNDSKEAVEQIKNQIKDNILTDNFETFVDTLSSIQTSLEKTIDDIIKSNRESNRESEEFNGYISNLKSQLTSVSNLIGLTNKLNDNISILLGDPSGGRKLKSKTFKHRKQTTKNKFTPNNKKNQGKNNTRKQKRVFKKKNIGSRVSNILSQGCSFTYQS